jgi:hypothetical protein
MQENRRRDRYLTLVPRGLESFVITNIKSQLETAGYACWISEIGPSLLGQLNKTDQSKDPLNWMAARIEYNKYKKKIKKRKKEKSNASLCQMATFEEFISHSPDLLHVTGSMEVPELGSHASLGYYTTQNQVVEKIVTVPGTLEGIVLLLFLTHAPPLFVASMLGMGPLLALVASSCLKSNINDNGKDPTMVDGKLFDYKHTLEDANATIETFFQSNTDSYLKQFKSALHLWQKHTAQVWHVPNSIYGHYKDEIHTASKATEISYRLSCIRSHSKKYAHKREELLPCLGDWLIPVDELNQTNFLDDILKQKEYTGATNNYSATSNKTTQWKWVVDLTDYDVEIVTLIHSGCLTVAMPLRPYQRWGSKSYRSNCLPVDGSGSFGRLGPKRSLGRYIHLRPSTAG